MQIQQYAKFWKYTVVYLLMHKWPNWQLVRNRLNEQLNHFSDYSMMEAGRAETRQESRSNLCTQKCHLRYIFLISADSCSKGLIFQGRGEIIPLFATPERHSPPFE